MKNGLHIDQDGTKRYYLNDQLHREDGPAEEWANSSKIWFLHGKRHRVDGPAEEWSNGTKLWYLHDEKHREDGPAEEWPNGSAFWWLNDKRHRVDGPAEEWAHGEKVWYINNKELCHPEEFKTMEAFIHELNDNEAYSLPWINDFNGLIEFIKNPSGKQTRLNAMRWKI